MKFPSDLAKLLSALGPKKKTGNVPRTKRMKKAARLSSASHWLDKYEGKNIVRGYMKRYGVDELAALIQAARDEASRRLSGYQKLLK